MNVFRSWFVLLAGVLLLGLPVMLRAEDKLTVKQKDKEIALNGAIDLHDEETAVAETSTENKGKFTVLSKTFEPPNPLDFKIFPNKPTHVDIASDPNALPALRKKDTNKQIKVERVDIPANNAGNMPLRTEGNLVPPGGPGGKPPELHWSVMTSVYDVTIGDVVRRADLPFSVPPGKTRDVSVVIKGQGTFKFEVINGNANNGNASIIKTSEGKDTLTQSGTITVQGDAVTEPKHSAELKIHATLNGKEVAISSGFSVCPHFDNYRLTGITADAQRYGFKVAEKWDSDSATGKADELDHCFRKEDVKLKQHDNPPWTSAGTNTDSGFTAGNHDGGKGVGTRIDQHLTPSTALENTPTKEGQIVKDQNHLFYCERCGMKKADAVFIPAPFTIVRDCSLNEKDEYVVTTSKDGAGGKLTSEVEPGQAPNPPSGLKAVANVDKQTNTFTITATWNDESDIESNFFMERILNGKPTTAKPDKDATTYTSPKLNLAVGAGQTYTITIRAVNWRGSSETVKTEVKIPE